MRTARALSTIAAALLTLGGVAPGAAAAVRISGSPDRLVLRAENASLAEVLAALRQALRLDISLKGGTAHTFTGTYSGSLRGVLTRLLAGDGHDFFLALRPGALQLALLDRKPGRAVPVAAVASTAAAAGDLADANDPGLAPLAAAAAGSRGSRDSRIRRQRLLARTVGPDPY